MGEGVGFVFFWGVGARKGFYISELLPGRRETSGAADQRTVALGKVVTEILMGRMG